MKIQDIIFFIVCIFLIILRKKKLFVLTGVVFYLLSIPLFVRWIFFTAERFTWYGSFLIFISFLIPKVSKSTVK